MSAQLLICKFAVFTCVFFFLPMPRVTRMAHWLAVCQDPLWVNLHFNTVAAFILTALIL